MIRIKVIMVVKYISRIETDYKEPREGEPDWLEIIFNTIYLAILNNTSCDVSYDNEQGLHFLEVDLSVYKEESPRSIMPLFWALKEYALANPDRLQLEIVTE